MPEPQKILPKFGAPFVGGKPVVPRRPAENVLASEGPFQAKAWWDKDQYSIGYGTKAKHKNEVISEPVGMARFTDAMKGYRNHVIGIGKKGGYKWNPRQLDALTAFAFNVGSINGLVGLDKHGKKWKSGKPRTNEEISSKMLEYNKAKNRQGELEFVQGLYNRRVRERALFDQKAE